MQPQSQQTAVNTLAATAPTSRASSDPAAMSAIASAWSRAPAHWCVGGLIAYRGLLCRCAGREGDDSLNDALGTPPTSRDVEPCRAMLLPPETLARYHQLRSAGVVQLDAHTAERCIPCVFFTYASLTPAFEDQQRILYAHVVRQKFEAARIEEGRLSPFMPCQLRTLPDGRITVVVQDIGGEILSTILTRERQDILELTQTSTSSHVASSRATGAGVTSAAAVSLVQFATPAWIRRVLQRSLDIANGLATYHRVSVVHKSVCPSNILINERTHVVELRGIQNASIVLAEKVEPDRPELSTYTTTAWRYLAPEQSGRANRLIDQRTDLYSLGCVMYEMLTGRPPFQSSDVLELIHMHLAKSPPPIVPKDMTAESHPHVYHALNAAAAIVQKLLSKAAEERYQSVTGLIFDLKMVLELVINGATQLPALTLQLLSSWGLSIAASPSVTVAVPSTAVAMAPVATAPLSLATFQCGLLDQSSTFRLSQRLYGRDEEVRALLRAYRSIVPKAHSSGDETDTPERQKQRRKAIRVGATTPLPALPAPADATPVAPHLLLIQGNSGVGKTCLINELHKHITRERGLFARGKFDQLKRDSACLIQAFRQLVVQLLVTDALTWKVRLLRALGTNGHVICEVIPELTRLIGVQPSVIELSTAESAKRFSITFGQFVSALATAASPLTLFVDDLQWADDGSLSLLQLILSQEPAHLLVVGVYRSNEVDADHPLTKLISKAKADHANLVTELQLLPLSTAHIIEFLVDSFRCTPKEAEPFAQVLFNKTQGNPFSLSTMLRAFYDQKLLTFNFTTARWEWQLGAIRLFDVQEDVASILCDRMRTHSSESQTLLQYAACYGTTFDLHTLLLVTQMPLYTLVAAARELEQSGLIICTAHVNDLIFLTQAAPSTPLTSAFTATAANSTAGGVLEAQLASITFRFPHDRIMAAAYKLIAPKQLPRVHLEITRQLVRRLGQEELGEHAANIAQHILVGYHSLLGSTTKSQTPTPVASSSEAVPMEIDQAPSLSVDSLASSPSASERAESQRQWELFFSEETVFPKIFALEYTAACQAKAARAFETAIKYLTAVLQLIQRKYFILALSDPQAADPCAPETSRPLDAPFYALAQSCWEDPRCYSFCLQVLLSLAQCYFLQSQYQSCSEVIVYTLQHLTAVADREHFFELHLQSLNQQLRMTEALETGLAYLKDLGVPLTSTMPPELEQWLYSSIDIANESTYAQHPVFALKECTRPVVFKVLSATVPATFMLQSPLFSDLAIALLQATRTYGLSHDSALGFAFYAMLLWPQSRLAENYALGRIASMLVERYGLYECTASVRVGSIVHSVVNAWRHPLRENVAALQATFELGERKQDLESANYCACHHSEQLIISNPPLRQAHAILLAKYKLYVKYGFLLASQVASLWLRICERYACLPPEERHVPVHADRADIPMVTCLTRLTDGIQAYLMDGSGPAIEMFEQVTPLLSTILGFASNSIYCQFLALAYLDCPKSTLVLEAESMTHKLPEGYDPAFVEKRLALAEPFIAKMAAWADRAPVNYKHKLALMQAERNRVRIFSHHAAFHLLLPTIALYEQSIAHAEANQYHIDLAISLEHIGRFYLDCQREQLAACYLKKAYHKYREYDGVLKLHQMVLVYPQVDFTAEIPPASAAAPLASPPSAAGARSSSTTPPENLLSPVSIPRSALATVAIQRTLHSLPTTPASPYDAETGGGSSGATPLLESKRLSGAVTSTVASPPPTILPASPLQVPSSGPSTSTHSPMPIVTELTSSTVTPAVSALLSPPLVASSSASSNDASVTAAGPHLVSNRSDAATFYEREFSALSVLKVTSTFSLEKDPQQLLRKLMRIVLETAGATRGALVLRGQQEEWTVELSASVEAEEKEDKSDEKTSGEESSPSVSPQLPSFNARKKRARDPPRCSSRNSNSSRSSGEEEAAVMQDTPTTSESAPVDALRPRARRPRGAHRRQRRKICNGSGLSVSPCETSAEGEHAVTLHSCWCTTSHKSKRLSSLSAYLPASIFHYCLKSEETLMLEDVQSSPDFAPFASDSYFVRHTPKALLCMPVLKAGVIFGVLYLENDFHTAAFTSSCIQLLQLYCGQAALSIDNARLYTELSQQNARLENQVLERTRQLEERNVQLQASKESAEKATKIKAEFLSNMSHEIRTPMNAVLGVSRLLADTQLSLEQQQYVQMINNSGNLLLTIINDILDYSKIEAGQLKLVFHPHNICDVVETAVVLCYDMATSKGLMLHWYVDPSLPPQLSLDAARLQQVLLNLMSNAIKFTRTGEVELRVTGRPLAPKSNLSVRPHSSRPLPVNNASAAAAAATSVQSPPRHAHSLRADLSPATDMDKVPLPVNSSPDEEAMTIYPFELSFSVRDTGIGISKEQLATLFQSFSQVQHNGEYGGTGLGLVISKRLVEGMGGGQIQVESEFGHGATFHFTIVTSIAAPAASSHHPSPIPLPTLSTAKQQLQPATASSSTAAFSSATTRRTLSPTALQLHGLTPTDLPLLSSAKLCYIGASHPSASNLRLLEFYHARVRVWPTVEEVLRCLREVASPPLPACSALIVDLDTIGMSEAALREALAATRTSMRVLLLYAKQHSSFGLPTCELAPAALNLATSLNASTSPIPFAYPPLAVNTGPASTPSLSSSSAHHSVQQPPTSQAVLRPTAAAPTSGLTSPLSSLSGLASPLAASLADHTGHVAEHGSVFVRLRKPFKAYAFLGAVTSLLRTPIGQAASVPHAPPTSARDTLHPLAFPSMLAASDITPSPVAGGDAVLHTPSSRGEHERASSTDSSSSMQTSPGPLATVGETMRPRIVNIARKYPLRILLAEDNLINQKVMIMMMRKLGYQILTAVNGREAIDILEAEAKKGPQHEIQVILMDASMDVMDGIECTRVIRSQQLPHRTRPYIIAQTANVTEEYREKCIASGMDTFIPKPIHIEKLAKNLCAAYTAHFASSSRQPGAAAAADAVMTDA